MKAGLHGVAVECRSGSQFHVRSLRLRQMLLAWKAKRDEPAEISTASGRTVFSQAFRRFFVSARTKLNHVNILGAIAVAGIIGGLTGSWPVFFVTTTALIIGAVCAGDIRPTGRRR